MPVRGSAARVTTSFVREVFDHMLSRYPSAWIYASAGYLRREKEPMPPFQPSGIEITMANGKERDLFWRWVTYIDPDLLSGIDPAVLRDFPEPIEVEYDFHGGVLVKLVEDPTTISTEEMLRRQWLAAHHTGLFTPSENDLVKG